MEIYKCRYLYTHSTFSFYFWVHRARSTQGSGALTRSRCLEPLIADTAGSPFSACPVVAHSIAINFRHVNKLLTIMAFTQLCLWGALASYSDCNSAICPSCPPCSILRDTWAGIPQPALYSMYLPAGISPDLFDSLKIKFTHKQSYSWLHWEGLAGGCVSQTVGRWIKIKGGLITIPTVQQNLQLLSGRLLQN